MKIVKAFILLLIPFSLNGQNEKNSNNELRIKLDSIIRVVNNLKEDTNRINTLDDLYYLSIDYNYDTALKYVDQSINLSEKLNFIKGIARSYECKANIYWYLNNYSQAEEFYLKALDKYEELQNKIKEVDCYNYLAEIYQNEGNYIKAIEYGQLSLKNAEEIGDKIKIADSYYIIGIVHRKQKNYSKAIEYYQKSLKISEELGEKTAMSHCYNSIGVLYRSVGNYELALEYYQKSLKIKEEFGDKNGMAIGFNNIGNVYSLKRGYSKAFEFYQKSLKIMEDINNKQGISMVYGNISSLYDSLKLFNEAIEFSNKSLKIAKEIGSIEDEKFAQENLYLSYKGLKDYKKALEHFELYKSLNDTIYNTEKFNQLAKMEAIYQSEKKQKEIELLKVLSAAESRKQRVVIYSVASILLLVLIFTILTYRSYLQKQKSNILLAEQKELIEEKNEELNQQNEEITAQRDDLFRQKSIALEQRDELTRQKKSITDSIAYAKHIQTAMLSNEDEINEVIPKSFVFFKPLDIVSGDFYWVNKQKGSSILAIADCTGHGVPGAFMSVMGINFLNSIVVEQGIVDPGEILNRLNQQVISALSHADTYMQDKDGMDISLCYIDWSMMIMHYSCARNRILVHRNGEIFQLGTSKYSIGKSPLVEAVEFSTSSFPIIKGDMIYLMTDGYVDQFGGPNKIKFLSSRFKKIIPDIANLDVNNQKNILEKTIIDWQGSYPQVDDMLIVGFKV